MVKIILVVILILIIFLIIKWEEKKTLNYVFINNKTKKYHQKECPYSKNLDSVTLEKAMEGGYTPCKICN